ncbi:hypothetical protein Godav_024061, partial [Gossypium davidsonii]|nr:hypothetical protein [Gossypium davidsonii]
MPPFPPLEVDSSTPAQVLKLMILLLMLMLPILITLMGSSLPSRHDCFKLERDYKQGNLFCNALALKWGFDYVDGTYSIGLSGGTYTSAGSLNSMIFTTLACLCVLSFLVGVLTDPGRVPSSYIPDVEDTSFASDQEPKKNVR